MQTIWPRFLVSPRRREKHRQALIRRLFALLETDGCLRLDREGLKALGSNYKTMLEILCDLLLMERLHLRSDKKGTAIVMSNGEFARFLFQRAEIAAASGREAEAKKEARRQPAALPHFPVPVVAACHGDESEGVVRVAIEPEEDFVTVFAADPLRSDPEYDWFVMEMADDETGADSMRILPDGRQALPSRVREPWSKLAEQSRVEKK